MVTPQDGQALNTTETLSTPDRILKEHPLSPDTNSSWVLSNGDGQDSAGPYLPGLEALSQHSIRRGILTFLPLKKSEQGSAKTMSMANAMETVFIQELIQGLYILGSNRYFRPSLYWDAERIMLVMSVTAYCSGLYNDSTILVSQ